MTLRGTILDHKGKPCACIAAEAARRLIVAVLTSRLLNNLPYHDPTDDEHIANGSCVVAKVLYRAIRWWLDNRWRADAKGYEAVPVDNFTLGDIHGLLPAELADFKHKGIGKDTNLKTLANSRQPTLDSMEVTEACERWYALHGLPTDGLAEAMASGGPLGPDAMPHAGWPTTWVGYYAEYHDTSDKSFEKALGSTFAWVPS
jgi:hypothetical protein